MANKLYDETSIQAIADAIRAKNGSSDAYKVSEMAQAIEDIPTGGGGNADYVEGTITIPSAITVSASGTEFPSLQLPWMPERLEIYMTKDSFEALSAPSNNHFYRINVYKKNSDYIPIRMTNTTSIETSYADSDYIYEYVASTGYSSGGTDTANGASIANNMYAVDLASRSAWLLDTDGTLTIARFSSSASYLYAGTYRYRAWRKTA